MPGTRDIAYDITRRVNSEGGYLSLLLRYGMHRSGLDPRDRSLVAELTYGVQRHRNKLDSMIAAFSRRPLPELDPEVLDVLRLGMYQLSEMRIPQHAAVNETVDLAKRRLGPGAASFTNAVMRSACGGLGGLTWPSREDLPGYLETVCSHPGWLVDYLLSLLGPEGAEALCSADNDIPHLTLRVNTARTDAPALLRSIESCDGRGNLSPCLEEALINVGLPYDRLLEFLEKGCCVVQDESSMLVSRAVRPEAEDTIIDACAAPGGKATHLARLGGEECRVIAVDCNARRLDALRIGVARLGLSNIDIREGDSTHLEEYVESPVDAVLVDAPCSGLGTLQRNPELKWRRHPSDFSSLADLQLALLMSCGEKVRAGGVMVYSVCTYTREETVDVINRFLAAHDDFRLQDLRDFLPPYLSSRVAPEGHMQLMLHMDHMEGMFIARMEKA